MFHIVDFKAHHHSKEKTVVPDIWLSIHNTLCVLPPNASSKELEGMAQNRVEPGPGWQIFGITLLQTFNTYLEAKKELDKPKETDEGPQRKRKKPGYLSEYSSQDLDHDHASPPITIFKTELLDLEDLSDNERIPPSELIMIPVGNKENRSSERIRKKVQGDSDIQEVISTPSVVRKDRKADCNRCNFLKDCLKVLKKQCKRLGKENCELSEENGRLREKYKARKAKHRNLKNQIKDNGVPIESNLVRIGNSTLVEKHKLTTCHQGGFRRFTGDLLEVVFGEEVLSNSSIKMMKGMSKKPLDAEKLQDIIMFTCDKFNVSAGIVRSAVSQKLNVCHKKARTRALLI